MSDYFLRVGEAHAAYLIERFYRRWRHKAWSHRQAADAFKHVKSTVEYWVGRDRANELLP